MSTMSITSNRSGKKLAPLTYFLGFIFVLFIGILVFCYAVTRRTTLIYLDEHGKRVAASSEHSHH
jgi:hypothetical protein